VTPRQSGTLTGTQGSAANPARGEAALNVGGEALVLRPTFEALVAAEEELGPLLALVERAAAGGLKLGEIAALFWHCVRDRPEGLSRERIGAALAELGLAKAAPLLRGLIAQILQGHG